MFNIQLKRDVEMIKRVLRVHKECIDINHDEIEAAHKIINELKALIKELSEKLEVIVTKKPAKTPNLLDDIKFPNSVQNKLIKKLDVKSKTPKAKKVTIKKK